MGKKLRLGWTILINNRIKLNNTTWLNKIIK